MKIVLPVLSMLALTYGALAAPVHAQGSRNDNPNMRNFYMARQQVQITDDAPAVNDLRSNPGAPQPAVPQPGQGLPRAGFSTFMSGYNGGNARSALPTVNNGVPKALPSAPGLTGQKANAGKLKAKAPAAPKGPAVAKTYTPYATTPTPVANSGSSGSLLDSSTSVKGSVLHWNKRH